MKNAFTLAGLLLFTAVQAQYFQHRYNLDYTTPKLRNERLNSGIVTRVNYINANPSNYYNVGIGTSYKNPNLAAPDNLCDRLRFIQLGTLGLTQFSNFGHQFAQFANNWYNAYGNSIAEIKNGTGTGGFVAVGAVTNNPVTQANNIPGNSDMLFTRLDAMGNVVSARRIDFDASKDMANCIRSSAVLFNGQPTWIVCGQTARNNFTDCFVARVLVDGTIVWARRYNFDFGGGQFNSAFCIARQLCEGPTGNIYVVGTIQDNPAGATGIDGLAFALTQNGAVIWADNYQGFTDDEFQAVRFSTNGTLAVGGFTNFGAVAPVTSHMLFTELNIANGAVIAQNILRAGNGANFFTSKCYDITEAPGNQYYLAGPVTAPSGIYEMMYRTNFAGIGINWYAYNRMNYSVGFGIDNAAIAPNGITYFASEIDSVHAAFSDSHIMKTDYSGKTCKFCPANPPSNLPFNLMKYVRANRNNPTGVHTILQWATFNYDNSATCNDAVITCDGAFTSPKANAAASALKTGTDIKKLSASIFPNPAKTVAILSISNASGPVQVSITDFSGKPVWQRAEINDATIRIDVSKLISGIYMVAIKDAKNSKTIQLIKE